MRCVSTLACVQQTSRILFLSREAKEIADTFVYKLQAIIYRQKKAVAFTKYIKKSRAMSHCGGMCTHNIMGKRDRGF